jgi:Fic family protein
MTVALDNFERFLHDEFGPTPPILKAGLAHAQFETIHPFLDGNGRIGRLLISLLLVVEEVLQQPFFYLSLYFKQHRADYYDALQRVRTHGDWEGWLGFYLIGVETVAGEAAATTRALLEIFEQDGQRVAELGRASGSALAVLDLLRRRVVLSPTRAAEELGLTWPTVNSALKRLQKLEIAREITGKKRDRLFAYRRQLEILNQGTEPLA